MPFAKVYIHFIWSTKNREPFLDSPELRIEVWRHIKENAKAKGISIDSINGYKEHCHCLISLGIDQTISKTISVSESILDKVRSYIKNQEDHHSKKTFQQEYDELIEKYRIPK